MLSDGGTRLSPRSSNSTALVQAAGLRKILGAFHLGPISFRADRGEVLGVMGPNGSGKTMLLRLAWGFLRPDEGTLRIFGLQPHLEQVRIRLRAGYLSQSPQFYNGLKTMRFLQFISAFYEGWDDTFVSALLHEFDIDAGVPIQDLTAVARVKLGLISALGHRPALLILDEPTSGLDPKASTDILDFIHNLARNDGVCVVLSSPVSNTLERIADRLILLNHGEVVEYSDTKSLLARHGSKQLEDAFLHAIADRCQNRREHRR